VKFSHLHHRFAQHRRLHLSLHFPILNFLALSFFTDLPHLVNLDHALLSQIFSWILPNLTNQRSPILPGLDFLIWSCVCLGFNLIILIWV
jgi:hypothetical protein